MLITADLEGFSRVIKQKARQDWREKTKKPAVYSVEIVIGIHASTKLERFLEKSPNLVRERFGYRAIGL